MRRQILTSKVTSKGQATLPRRVRDLLGIKAGDTVIFAVEHDTVTLRRAEPLDAGFLKLAGENFVDWNAPEADAAFRDL